MRRAETGWKPVKARQEGAFRSDIEGLRALAILPILIFHLSPAAMPGGFVGVDIFFVISGYLITGSILRQGDNFSYRSFLYRRFRRLYPALCVTVIGGLIAGYALLAADAYEALAWSAIASLAGLANFYFAVSLDYFGRDALLHPNLHIWSLAVEEQFYLFWPFLILWVVRHKMQSRALLICLVALTGVALSMVLQPLYPQAAFYLMPFRVFEFAIGALLALGNLSPPVRMRQALPWIGLLGLLWSFAFLSEHSAWPGLQTLVPCLATAALIAGDPKGPAARILSTGPIRFIGRISYSVYLTHWPLITFAGLWLVVPPGLAAQVVLFIASLLSGYLLFVLVEEVFRIGGRSPVLVWLQNRKRGPTVEIGRLAFALPAGGFAVAAAIILANGLPARLHGDIVQKAGKPSFGGDICSSKRSLCVFADQTSRREFVIIGDSHAMNFFAGLDQAFAVQSVRALAFYDHGCLFLIGTRRFERGGLDQRCADNVDQAYDHLRNSDAPVMIVSNWGGYQDVLGLVGEGVPRAKSRQDYVALVRDALEASLRELKADRRRVVIVLSSYNTGIDLLRCYAARGETAGLDCQPAKADQSRAMNADIDQAIAEVAAGFAEARVLDPVPGFCSDQRCTVSDNDRILFRDTDHLTIEGSLYWARTTTEELRALLFERKRP